MKLAITVVPIKAGWANTVKEAGEIVVVNAGSQAKKDEYVVTFLTKPFVTATIKRNQVVHLTPGEKKLVRLLFL